MIGAFKLFLFSEINSNPLLPGIIISKTKRSNFIIEIFSFASNAFEAVFTRYPFSFKNCLSNDLIPSSSSTTKICDLKFSIDYSF